MPYVTPKNRPAATADAPVPLWKAVNFANSAKEEYLSALKEYGAIPGVIAVPIIAMGAAALGLGIAGTSGAAITALGLAGAATLGAGTWYQNKPREAVYITGYNAITCLVESTRAVQLPSAVETQLNAALFGYGERKNEPPFAQLGLIALRAKLIAQIHLVEGSTEEESGAVNKDKLVAEATHLYDQTEAIAQAGLKLTLNMASVGQDLVNRVDDVIGLVNEALRQTEPNVQALGTLVSGLTVPSGKPPTPTSAPSQPQTKPKATTRSLTPSPSDVLYALEAAVAEAATQVSTIVTSLASVGAPDPVRCVALAKGVPASLSLSPEGDFDISPGQTKRILVSSGQPPYAATLLTPPDNKDDLTVKSTSDNAVFYVEVTASGSAKTGKSYSIAISDRTGATKIVKATLK